MSTEKPTNPEEGSRGEKFRDYFLKLIGINFLEDEHPGWDIYTRIGPVRAGVDLSSRDSFVSVANIDGSVTYANKDLEGGEFVFSRSDDNQTVRCGVPLSEGGQVEMNTNHFLGLALVQLVWWGCKFGILDPGEQREINIPTK